MSISCRGFDPRSALELFFGVPFFFLFFVWRRVVSQPRKLVGPDLLYIILYEVDT